MLVEHCGFKHFKITAALKRRVHGLYDLRTVNGEPLPFDAYEALKDRKRPEFGGKTPRQAYIDVWNKYLVPEHGENILVEQIINTIDASDHDKFVISDLGMDREAQFFFDYYGTQCLALKIRRPGHTFDNDIRKYVDRKHCMVKTRYGRESRLLEINNSGVPLDMLKATEVYYKAVFNKSMFEKKNDRDGQEKTDPS